MQAMRNKLRSMLQIKKFLKGQESRNWICGRTFLSVVSFLWYPRQISRPYSWFSRLARFFKQDSQIQYCPIQALPQPENTNHWQGPNPVQQIDASLSPCPTMIALRRGRVLVCYFNCTVLSKSSLYFNLSYQAAYSKEPDIACEIKRQKFIKSTTYTA